MNTKALTKILGVLLIQGPLDSHEARAECPEFAIAGGYGRHRKVPQHGGHVQRRVSLALGRSIDLRAFGDQQLGHLAMIVGIFGVRDAVQGRCVSRELGVDIRAVFDQGCGHRHVTLGHCHGTGYMTG
jgi:hypothetical protein